MKTNRLITLIASLFIFASLVGCNKKNHEHEYVFHEEVAATCEISGKKAYYSCSGCKKIFDENKTEVTENELAIHPHASTLINIGSDSPTCTGVGHYSHFECSVCHKIFSDDLAEHEIELSSIEIAATGHSLIHIDELTPTCVADGHHEHYECVRCHKYFSDANGATEIQDSDFFVSKLGHNMENHPALQPTCVTDGNSEYHYCTRCHKYFSDTEGQNEIQENSWIIEGHHHMEYHPAKAMSFNVDGEVEHYHCTQCGKNYEDEAGTHEITTPVIIKAPRSLYSFEDGEVPSIFAVVQAADPLTVTEEAASDGTKSLKVKATGRNTKVSFDRDWLNMVFSSEDSVLLFDIKGSATINSLYYSSIADTFHAKWYKPYETNNSILQEWKTYQFTKAMFDDLQNDNAVVYFDDSTESASVYIDNIRLSKVVETKDIASFENSAIINADNSGELARNVNFFGITDKEKELRITSTKGDDQELNVSFSEQYVSHGHSSLHVTTQNGKIEVFVSKALYDNLDDSGVVFDLYSPNGANPFHVKNEGSSEAEPRGYMNGDSGWVSFRFPKNKMGFWNGDWARLFTTDSAGNFEVYIDNIHPARNALNIGFEEEKIHNDSDLYTFRTYVSHESSITNELAHSGNRSFRVNCDANGRALIIGDVLYNLLPNEGISFWIYSRTAFNSDNVVYSTPNEWKQFTVAKSDIHDAYNDHYVFLPYAATTLYIDDICIAH